LRKGGGQQEGKGKEPEVLRPRPFKEKKNGAFPAGKFGKKRRFWEKGKKERRDAEGNKKRSYRTALTETQTNH